MSGPQELNVSLGECRSGSRNLASQYQNMLRLSYIYSRATFSSFPLSAFFSHFPPIAAHAPGKKSRLGGRYIQLIISRVRATSEQRVLDNSADMKSNYGHWDTSIMNGL